MVAWNFCRDLRVSISVQVGHKEFNTRSLRARNEESNHSLNLGDAIRFPCGEDMTSHPRLDELDNRCT